MAVAYFFVGILGGVLGGMGMGGGTLLIPLLTTIFEICQKQAQFLNILSFIFMAIFVVVFQIKNGFVKVFPAIVFSVVGALFSLMAAFLVKGISESVLKVIFGVFLILLACVQIFVLIKNKTSKKNKF